MSPPNVWPYRTNDHPVKEGRQRRSPICFELARLLEVRYGLSPVHLFVSGHNAPQTPAGYDPIHHLPDDEFVEQIRCLNGMSEQLLENQELMRMLLPILRADFCVCETYAFQTGRPVSCPISVLGGVADQYLERQRLEAWGEQTRASCTVRLFPGDHFYVSQVPYHLLRTIAAELLSSAAEHGSTTDRWRDSCLDTHSV